MKIRTTLLASVAAILTAALAAQAQVPGVNSTLQSVFTLAYDNSTMKPSYSATVANATAVASQTDMCSLSGSATKTVKVRRIFFSSTPTTTVSEPVAILKRSTANTGAGSAIAKVAYDTSNAASTVAVAELWTAAPTVGTLTGVLADLVFNFPVATGVVAPVVFEFGELAQPIVLRGAAQSVAVNLSGITFTGTVGCTFEWTEE